MSIRRILRMGNIGLCQPAAPVDDPTAPSVRNLVADMVETMEAAEGTGLAAPQIGVLLRILIFQVGEAATTDDPDDTGMPLLALCNPSMTVLETERPSMVEGCLSVPGMLGWVPRWNRIRYTGVTPDGRLVETVASGWHARVFQHEFDHLNGVLYPSRVQDATDFGFREEILERLQKNTDTETVLVAGDESPPEAEAHEAEPPEAEPPEAEAHEAEKEAVAVADADQGSATEKSHRET